MFSYVSLSLLLRMSEMLGGVQNQEEEMWFLEGLCLNITNKWWRAESELPPATGLRANN